MRLYVWLILAAAVLRPFSACADDKEDLRSAVRQFVDAYSRGDAKAIVEMCSDGASVLYDVPPYRWSGPHSCALWLQDVKNEERRIGISNTVARIERIRHVIVSGKRAYVTADLYFSFLWNGKAGEERDQAVFTYQRISDTWMLSGFSLAL